MLSVRDRPLPATAPPRVVHDRQPAAAVPVRARRELLDDLDVLHAWRGRDVGDFDVDEADDLALLGRLRDEDDATDWIGI
jgi:hypothetical protein